MRDSELQSKHVIEVSSEGFLYDLRPHQKKQIIQSPQESERYLLETVFDGFQHSGKKKILLFVHGGLNDRNTGMSHFWDDYENILKGEYYPVFVVWPSGWTSTYLEHLLWVRQGIKAETPNEKTFSILTSPLTLLADLGRAFTRLPIVVANNSRSDIETVTPIRNREGGAAVRQYQELATEGYPVAVGDDYSLGSDRLVRGLTYWATLPVKYVLASFIDGLGKGAWDTMLRRTQEVYPARLDRPTVEWTERLKRTNEVYSPTAPKPAGTQLALTKRQENRAQRYAAAGLPMFIETVRKRQQSDPSLELSLVGHSMGTIILNRVVRDAQMEFANIVYMGAACSIEDFSMAVLPYMREHTNAQFYNLSLHPVAEVGEWQAAMADLPPRGSLLVWIDNFLANPVSERERMLGRWRNLFMSGATGEPIIRHFFVDPDGKHLKDRLHFHGFSVGFGDKDQLRKVKFQWNEHPRPIDASERIDNPLSHGEFSEMPYWKSTFWWRPKVEENKPRTAAPPLNSP